MPLSPIRCLRFALLQHRLEFLTLGVDAGGVAASTWAFLEIMVQSLRTLQAATILVTSRGCFLRDRRAAHVRSQA